MKIILTAFGGKLRSEPMDWPENMRGRDFYMMMDMDRLSATSTFTTPAKFETMVKRGKFIPTGGFELVKNKTTAEVYKLVEID